LEEEEPKPPKRRVAVWMVVLASVICLLSTFGIVIVSVLLARGGDVGNLTPTITIHGAVAADTQLCSEAGVSILQEGGNAIDAGKTLEAGEITLLLCVAASPYCISHAFVKRWQLVFVRVL